MEYTIAEYVWIGGRGELHSKTMIIRRLIKEPLNVAYYPKWNYDGSSTNQAEGDSSEIFLQPVCVFWDPFRKDQKGVLVLCETYNPNGTPAINNNRSLAYERFDKKMYTSPWFGLEQEYYIYKNSYSPLNFHDKIKQGSFYCSCGSENTFGRQIAEDHLNACLYSGIKVSGINSEVGPAQWEFQVGPLEGISAGDHLVMARYILNRVSEKYGLIINYDPKPERLESDKWNGSGCHINFSTLFMRNKNYDCMNYIVKAIDKLSENHTEHMMVYGENNIKRLTGKNETSSFAKFTSGKANRNASVRIGNETLKNNCGYFEDRRPASNIDPYLATSTMYNTIVIDDNELYPELYEDSGSDDDYHLSMIINKDKTNNNYDSQSSSEDSGNYSESSYTSESNESESEYIEKYTYSNKPKEVTL